MEHRNPGIMNAENLAPTSPSNLLSNNETCLMDLPDELILAIAQCLYRKKKDEAWYDCFDHWEWSRVGREDALAFSACCKDTRRVVFLEWIVRDVAVGLNEREQEDFASMSSELRSHVRYAIALTRIKTESLTNIISGLSPSCLIALKIRMLGTSPQHIQKETSTDLRTFVQISRLYVSTGGSLGRHTIVHAMSPPLDKTLPSAATSATKCLQT